MGCNHSPMSYILLSALTSLANGLLNDALRSPIGKWAVKLGRHMLTTVSEQGANIGGRLYISFIKWLVSMVLILYLKYCQTNSAGISIWHKNRRLLYWYTIARWYDEKLLCCHRVKICEFTKNKQGVSQCFHLHERASPTALPRWVNER